MEQPKGFYRQEFYSGAKEKNPDEIDTSADWIKERLGLFAFICLGALFVVGIGAFAIYGLVTFVTGV